MTVVACANGAEVRLDIVVGIIAIVKIVAAVMTYLFFSYWDYASFHCKHDYNGKENSSLDWAIDRDTQKKTL